ncbi:hypothetical protein D1BOALGB6SA_4594 [Olavius sp. associated proteobacterium Delta 1]|nr:hypothetical protein D1BOALGB6SA_4594 [Olavius sp. associated proteobacterium Delta 1]
MKVSCLLYLENPFLWDLSELFLELCHNIAPGINGKNKRLTICPTLPQYLKHRRIRLSFGYG